MSSAWFQQRVRLQVWTNTTIQIIPTSVFLMSLSKSPIFFISGKNHEILYSEVLLQTCQYSFFIIRDYIHLFTDVPGFIGKTRNRQHECILHDASHKNHDAGSVENFLLSR